MDFFRKRGFPHGSLHFVSIKNRLERFSAAAPKTRITEGTVLEITVTPPDGQPLSMNLKVAAQDLDALNQLMGLAGQASQP